jgi:uncharacterized protein (DUF433 family)
MATQIDVQDMLRRYRSGERVADIAASFGCTQQTIRNWLRDLCEPRRPVGRPNGGRNT